MISCFVDTNVFLDMLLHRTNGERAVTFFKESQKQQIQLVTSISCVQTVLYVLEREKIPIAKRRRAGKLMGQLTQIIPTTSGMLISAMDEPIKDLEDAILWQTAISNGCNCSSLKTKRIFL